MIGELLNSMFYRQSRGGRRELYSAPFIATVALAVALLMRTSPARALQADTPAQKAAARMMQPKDPNAPPPTLRGDGDKPATLPATTDHGKKDGSEPRAIPASNEPRPIISVDEAVHDFGSGWAGPTLKHGFKVKNDGTSTLEISSVRPSCGCTIAGSYPRKLEPGETGEFPFSLNSGKLRGPYEKSITVASNDPVTPELRLKLKGEIKQYVDVVPAQANFGRVTAGQPQERILKVTNNTEQPLRLELEVPPDSKYQFELVETTPGQNFDLKVKLSTQQAAAGAVRSTAKLKTNVEALKEITVDATAVIPERLEIQPQEIIVATPAAGGPGTDAKSFARSLRFNNYGEKPVKVLEATASKPEVKVTVSERTAGKDYTIQVDVPADFKPAEDGSDKVTIKTDDPEKPTIDVPMRSRIQVAKKLEGQAPNVESPTDKLIGKPAPTFELTTTEGKKVSNESLKDAVTVLNFFAVNCGYCGKQIPRLETVREKYAGKPVRIINVSQTMRGKQSTPEEVAAKLTSLNCKSEAANDPQNTVGPLFAASGFPTMVVLGKNGNVEAINVGNVGDLEERMAKQLDALIEGKPIPKDALGPDKTAQVPKPPTQTTTSLIGKPAPAFSINTTDGKALSSDEIKTRPATVLNFVAPDCPHCKKQIPGIETVRKDYEAKGVRFVNLSQTMRQPFTADKAAEVFKGAGSGLEFALDEGNKVGQSFFATSYPTMVLVGKSGNVEAVNSGSLADIESRLRSQLDAVIEGKPLPKFADAQAQPSQQRPAMGLMGKPAPAFSLKTLDGKVVGNEEFPKSAATVLNFVAPDCGFCKKQLPTVEAIRAEYEAKGVRFVNVTQKFRGEFTTEQVVETMKGVGARLEIAPDDGNKVGQMYQAVSYPTMMVVDKTGKVANVNIGAPPTLDKDLRGQLDSLLGVKPTSDAAKAADGAMAATPPAPAAAPNPEKKP